MRLIIFISIFLTFVGCKKIEGMLDVADDLETGVIDNVTAGETYYDEEGNEIFTGDDGNDGSNCIVGTWYEDICGGSYQRILNLSSNGTGSQTEWDCTGVCTRIIEFNYTDNSSSLYIDYTYFEVCETAGTPPSSESWTYSCEGTSLNLNGLNFYK